MISAPDAERAIIGSFMLSKEAIESCIDYIAPEHFYEAQNALLCKTAYEMFRGRQVVDAVTVSEALRKDNLLEGAGGANYLAECIHRVTTASHARHYAAVVLGLYYERQIVSTAAKLAQDQSQENLKEIQSLVLRKESLGTPPVLSYKSGLIDFHEAIQQGSKASLYKTGIPALDAIWYGARAGEVCTIGAATNVGKSIFLLNIMNLMAQRNISCLYFGTEMSSIETASRHLSIISGVAAYKIRIGKLDLSDWAQINDAVGEKMQKLPIAIYDNPEPTVSEIEQAVINSGAKVVFLDYLERFKLPPAESMRHRVKQFMVDMKTMARKREVVVFIAAQLGRNTYGQVETPPSLSDLSESKAIEQESDKVLLLWTPKAKQNVPGKYIIEANAAKNRAGKRNIVFDLAVDDQTLKMEEHLVLA